MGVGPGTRRCHSSDEVVPTAGKTTTTNSYPGMKNILVALAFAIFMTSGGAAFSADTGGFRPLFNGKDLTGWHLRNPKGHNSWTVESGVLKNTVNPGEHGTDLVTDSKFFNFTVKYEFMVPDGSNSGFYLRGRHELQIFGDYESGKPTKNGNGAI